MPAVPALAAVVALASQMAHEPQKVVTFPPPASRFQLRQPLSGVPPILMDTYGYGANIANTVAGKQLLQARVMWIDATANVDRYNTEGKIVALVQQIKSAGFNTIALDVKPISGHVIYPSQFAPKLTDWKGRILPVDFDPVSVFVRECKKAGLSLLFSLNAFSEGHSLMKVGPAYQNENWQSVLYDTKGFLELQGQHIPLGEKKNVAPAADAVTYVDAVPSLPALSPDVVIATVDWPRNAIAEIVDGAVTGAKLPTIPNRGYALVGTGASADFLRKNAALNLKVVFGTEPVFARIGSLPDQQVPLMVNPNDPEVQDHALAIIREVASKYEADGFLYDDRFRYAGMNADFSPWTQALFERYIGHPIRWPDDVFKFTITPSFTRGIAPGPYYDAWMAWRALQMRNYLARVHDTIHMIRPKASVGLYVGSWFGEYPAYGVNIASPDLHAGFWFLTPEYRLTGIAPLLDVLICGAYYPTPTVHEGLSTGAGIGNTVEAAGQLTTRVARDQCWTYTGIMLSQYKDDPDRLSRALQAACGASQGIMIFDLSHDADAMWPTFTAAFAGVKQPPHLNAKALAEVRRKRSEFDKRGGKEDPPLIAQGSSGTGF
ncbi:MAG: hypothetical protein QOJ65_2460 [Fimbriimonadaceae bacterium]|jgi:hypothetical protein|nr:hypothetical protein [Fimbriimonadaceae bacterium]